MTKLIKKVLLNEKKYNHLEDDGFRMMRVSKKGHEHLEHKKHMIALSDGCFFF